MKTYNKSGHLQGNTTVGVHSAPYFQSNIPAQNGTIASLASISGTWVKELHVETAQITIQFVFTNTTTAGGTLSSIVNVINSTTANQAGGSVYVQASISSGALVLQTTDSSPSAFIRILPATTYESISQHFGFLEHPHSQATVTGGSIKNAAVDVRGQQNPTGTMFLANGEDRTSENYNRALSAVAVNADVNNAKLTRGLAVIVQLKLPVDINNPTQPNIRCIIDSSSFAITGIDLSANISDSFSSLLENRILTGTLDSTSNMRSIRNLFQIADLTNTEMEFQSGVVRVSSVVTGTPLSYANGPLALDDVPNVNASTSSAINDGKSLLGATVYKATSEPITDILDGYTIVCSAAAFTTAGVCAGDVVEVQGSQVNDGQYLVQTVISDTVLELKPYSLADMSFLDATDTTGVISIYSNMWSKNVTLVLTEPIPLPLRHDILISVPMEYPLGELPEDALINKSAIQITAEALKPDATLELSYKGSEHSGIPPIGYYIDTESVPVTIVPETSALHSGTVNRAITTGASIAANNIVELSLTSSDYFSDADLGKILRITPASVPSTLTDASILVEDLAVIVKLLTPKKIEVRKLSRTSQDFATSTAITKVEVLDDCVPFVPAGLVIDANNKTLGGYGIIDSGNLRNSYIHMKQINKLDPLNVTPSVFSVTTSNTYIIASNIDINYLLAAYGNSELLCYVYNGPNAGVYRVVNLTLQANQARVYVHNLDGTTVAFATNAAGQYCSLYTIPQGFDLNGQSSAYIFADNKKGVVVHRKSESPGIYVEASANFNIDSTLSYVSYGYNIESHAGAGAAGIYSVTNGKRGYVYSATSGQEVAIPNDFGRGAYAIKAQTASFHLDPEHISGLSEANEFSYKGTALFINTKNDPALIATDASTSVLTEKVTASNVVLIGKSVDTAGATALGLSVYGDVFIQNTDASAATFYTESLFSAQTVYGSQPSVEDISTDNAAVELGSAGVIARFDSDYGPNDAILQNVDYSKFDIPHAFILKIIINPSVSRSGPAPEFVNTLSNLDIEDPSRLIGSYVYFTNNGSTTYSELFSKYSSYGGAIPLALGDLQERPGIVKGFKVLATKREESSEVNLFLCLQKEQGSTLNLSSPTSKVSCIIFRKRFVGSLDITSWMQLGASKASILRSFAYNNSAQGVKHRLPVVSSANKRATIQTGNISLDPSAGVISATMPANLSHNTVSNTKGVSLDSNVLPTLPAFSTYGWGSANQAPFYGTRLTNISSSGFMTSGDLGRSSPNLDDIVVTSIASNNPIGVFSCVTGQNGIQTLFGRAFIGGGRKLVLHSAPWETTSVVTLHTLAVKVGAHNISSTNTILCDIQLAFTYVKDSSMYVSLMSGSNSLSSKTIPLVENFAYLYKKYKTYQVEFSQYYLDGLTSLLEAAENDNLYIKIVIRTDAGFTVSQESANVMSVSQKEDVGRSTAYIPVPRADRDYFSYELDEYPSVVFIRSIEIKSNKEQAIITSGIDIEGPMRPRQLRMLNAVTGHQVIGPAQVDLLQNTEYGNAVGQPSIFSLIDINTVVNTSSTTANKTSNLEGNGVGLLPMWFLTSFTTNSTWSKVYISLPASLSNITVDCTAHPVDIVNGYNTFTSTVGIPYVPYTAQHSWTALYDYRRITDVTGDDIYRYVKTRAVIKTGYYSPFATLINHGIYLEIGTRYEDVDPVTGDSEYYRDVVITYKAGIVFTKFYRPTLDTGSFFRKGIHSAAIHAHTPYFDPMFYWEYCATGIDGGYNPSRLENKVGTLLGSATLPTSFKWDIGSYKLDSGKVYTNLIDSKVNPDAYVPPGRTGFVIPLDPPHGSILTAVELTASFRPMVSRKIDNATDSVSDTVNIDYGVWHSCPATPFSTGEQWLKKSDWQEREGYIVRVWRHTLFDEGVLFGETSSIHLYSAKTKDMEGNATLLHEQIVSIRNYTLPDQFNGKIGSPANLVNLSTGDIEEGISRLKIILPESTEFTVNRASYSYFVTIEFYTGVRKVVARTSTDGTRTVDTYTVPGLVYHPGMHEHNVEHFPYMWTDAFPGEHPQAMSSVWGQDRAVKFKGNWVPHPVKSAMVSEYYNQSVIRYHALNTRAVDPGTISSTGDITTSFSVKGLDSLIKPTTDASGTKNISYTPLMDDSTLRVGLINAQDLNGNNNIFSRLLSTPTQIPDQSVWYPIVKFRGLRLTYQMDRPGHGGWGG